jgi:hypothetical protein
MGEILIKNKVKIRLMYPKNKNQLIKEEIWAEIFDKNNDKILKELIWFRDKEGVSHDESYKIPIKYRDKIDNAWISSIKKL